MSDPINKAQPVITTASALAAPSPLQIGKAFIKQYYQVLSTNPTQITKFYKSNSVINHSLLPSVPAQPKTLADLTKEGQIFQWCRPQENSLCFDFGSGAIDAQETINGGILLVVTGHIKLRMGDEGDQVMRKFVQTFFLNNGAAAGKKRQFYVHNDVLRFLDGGIDLSDGDSEDDPEDDAIPDDARVEADNGREAGIRVGKTTQESSVLDVMVGGNVENDVGDRDSHRSTMEDLVIGEKLSNESQKNHPTDNVNNDRDEKEELKEEKDIVEDTNINRKEDDVKEHSFLVGSTKNSYNVKPEEKKTSMKTVSEKKSNVGNTNHEKKSRKNKSRSRSRKSRSFSPTDGSKSKKIDVHSSWASLVAGGSGPSAVAAAAASAAAKIAKEEKSTSTNLFISNDCEIKKETLDSKHKSESTRKPSNKESTGTPPDQQSKRQQQEQDKKTNANAQRSPEATILIKNIPDKAKEAEIRNMFEPYAAKLQKRILGITLLASRGFCFVDFDSKAVVDEIVKAVQTERAVTAGADKDGEGGVDSVSSKKFVLNGKLLDVGRKVPDKIGNRGRGFRRSASPGNNRGGGYNKHNRNAGARRGSPRGSNRSSNKK